MRAGIHLIQRSKHVVLHGETLSASVCFGCRKKSDLSTCTTYKASFQGIINVRNKWLGQMAMYSRSCKYAVTQLLEC